MKPAFAPAAVPAFVFLLAIFAEGLLRPSPVGALVAGIALAAALRGRPGVLLAALFLGLLTARLQPDPGIAGFDPERPAEAAGQVDGEWREEAGGASAPLRLDLVRQGTRIWIEAPEVRLELAGRAGTGSLSALPPAGSRIRVRGHLQRSPGFANAHPIAPGGYRLRVKSARLLAVERPPPLPMRALERLRATVSGPLAEAAARHPGVGYARGLLLGDLESIPASERLAFRRSGLAHLLAVSGMNVALVAGVTAALASFCRRTLRLALVAGAVLLHLALVGPVPSLLRATLMSAAVLLGLVLERRALALQSLALAASAMAALDPSLVRDLGFCLSCSATFGLVVLAPAALRRWVGGRHPLAVALAVSWAAQAATLPWSLTSFSYLTPAAPLLNLVAVPLAGLLLVGALGWIALAVAVPAAGDLAALPLDLLALPFQWLPELPVSAWLCLPMPPSWGLGLALAVLAMVAVSSPRAARRTLLALLLLTARPRSQLDFSREVEWVVADVGQGDGSLLRQGATAVLIDGGGGAGLRLQSGRRRDYGAQVWLPLLAARGLARLDAVAVTHGDSDHCGGLIDVASYVPIAEVWAAQGLREDGCVREILALSRARFRGLGAGDSVRRGGLRFAVLGPPADVPGAGGGIGGTGASGARGASSASGNDNDRSLVLAIEAEGRRLLLTGDVERRAELELLSGTPEALRCDLLKVAHHGSATSSSALFLTAARPRLALLSCGVENRFGHPAAGVVDRLGRAGSRLLRTDLSGQVGLRWRRDGPLAIDLPGSPRAVLGRVSE